jgi:hypothetical protein
MESQIDNRFDGLSTEEFDALIGMVPMTIADLANRCRIITNCEIDESGFRFSSLVKQGKDDHEIDICTGVLKQYGRCGECGFAELIYSLKTSSGIITDLTIISSTIKGDSVLNYSNNWDESAWETLTHKVFFKSGNVLIIVQEDSFIGKNFGSWGRSMCCTEESDFRIYLNDKVCDDEYWNEEKNSPVVDFYDILELNS